MRAIISCITPLSNEEIKAVFNDINWLPNACIDEKKDLDSFKELIEKQRLDILKDIPGEETGVNEDTGVNYTTFLTILDGYTKTWGTVTRVNKYRITIRLKNPGVETLKLACESLVNLLRSPIPYKTLKRGHHSFSIPGKICKKIRGIKRYYSYLKSNGCKKNDLEKMGENSKGGPCGNYEECDRSNALNLFCGEPLFKFNPIIHVLEKIVKMNHSLRE